MTEYGTMKNGQLIRHKNCKEGDKPIVYTECPESEFVCQYRWEERENEIVQVWEITDIPKEEDERPLSEELTDAEALAILLGGAV